MRKSNRLNWRLLKKLYAIHSPSGREWDLMEFLVNHISKIPGVKTSGDDYGNLYVCKGEATTYPCIVAHLDQVQHKHSKDFQAIETKEIIFGYSSRCHQYEGLGADDKNGVFIALEALRKYESLKVAFFREEEIGCRGSSNADMGFFEDCRFVIQCDRKGNSDLVTNIGCTELCSEKFMRDIHPEKWGYAPSQGMMTDVEVLRENGLNVSAVNISCGYYNPHTDHEITVKRDLVKCWKLVCHIIDTCTEVYGHDSLGGCCGFFNDYEDAWDVESEIFSILDYDPSLTGDDLYDCYHTNFPFLTREHFHSIVEEYLILHGEEQETKNSNIANYGKETDNNMEEDIF